MHALSRCVWAVLAISLLVAADDVPTTDADKEALSPLQVFIGDWKGVGQPKRGSSAGSWTEQAQWAWQFGDDGAAIVFQAADGKYFTSGRIEPGDETSSYVLTASATDQPDQRFTGKLDDEGRLIFTADEPVEGRPAQVSLRTVANGDRLLVLYEARRGDSAFARLAEVGYTRKGSGFGQGGGGPECVVTGGYGTMQVEYMGKKYYVCCTGCKDLFESDPEGVLADYRERKQKEKEERERDE